MISSGFPALFLDRDGVINEDLGYVHTPEETIFVPGIFDLVKRANSAGYKVIVVTNQAGIGRGFYSEDNFVAYMKWQESQFRKNGARIDGVYYCPHHPNHGIGLYNIQCDCRKPSPGLVLKAANDLNIELSMSIMVGDNLTDVACGIAAGVGKNYQLMREGVGVSSAGACYLGSLDELNQALDYCAGHYISKNLSG